ncbi:hypothetical protein [Parerythrobacter aestuarii]|uniref:hypothetical protein n=1 Tax=Parerythrobacter aestuarii TaxID=3020909 RepID=UPI0024DE57D8|nr:hypothetical protein [Parerythrobacter aestuarii]
MMRRSRFTLAVLLVAAAVPMAPAWGQAAEAIAQEDRRIASLRPVAVQVPQQEMEISVDVGRVAMDPGGGGLLDGLIVRSMDNKKDILTDNATLRAEAEAAPLIAALEGFDPVPLALDATETALAELDWFGTSLIGFVLDGDGNLRSFASANPGEQLGHISFSYQMSPDFTQVQVVADVSVLKGATLAPLYAQRIVSIVRLNNRSYENFENVARWSANDGELVRAAMTKAFARLGTVIPAVMSLDPGTYAAKTSKRSKDQALVASFHGPVLMRDDLGAVIWSQKAGFVTSQSAGD